MIPGLPLLLTPARGWIAKQHPLLKLQLTKEAGLWVQPASCMHLFYAIGAQTLISDASEGLRAPSGGLQVIAAEWCSDTPGPPRGISRSWRNGPWEAHVV